MSYSENTVNDKNPLKRWLQRLRLASAIDLSRQLPSQAKTICDFGAGDGELCKILARQYPSTRIFCYEPTLHILSEARENLALVESVVFYADIQKIEAASIDRLFCLEVFEHLTPGDSFEALEGIYELLKPGGIAIIGVPVETGIPAVYKGLFRMTRRYGAFDANITNIARAFVGNPPKNRPISETEPGIAYHYDHMGFRHHELKKVLSGKFKLLRHSTSPVSWVGAWLMPEIYFVVQKNMEA